MFLFLAEPFGIVSYYFTYSPNPLKSFVERVQAKNNGTLFHLPAKALKLLETR